MNRFFVTALVLILVFSCQKRRDKKPVAEVKKEQINKDTIPKSYLATNFDFPVGKPSAKGYYNAQKFKKNNHLGDDWNSVKGGNSDLGDPIYVIANGYVKETHDYGGGWGKVVRVLHYLPNNKTVESLYAHCNTIDVKSNTWIKKGRKIGTIGTADGAYLAHLHFEIRDNIDLPIGNGYSTITEGYLDPTEFIKKNRQVK